MTSLRIASEPTPIRSELSPIVAQVRRVALLGIALDRGCTEDEAAALLDAPESLVVEVNAAERRALEETARVERILRELKMPIRDDLIPLIASSGARHTAATREAGAWLRSPRRVLAMLGNVGVGKTVAAGLVAAYHARKRRTVSYVREPLLVRWSERRTLVHEERLEIIGDVSLLIVDELGTSLAKPDAVREAISAIVDHRIGVPDARTILIGNLTPAQLRGGYGARFADRVIEIGTIAHLTGESLRGDPGVQAAESDMRLDRGATR